jgi:hypothetical protein
MQRIGIALNKELPFDPANSVTAITAKAAIATVRGNL